MESGDLQTTTVQRSHDGGLRHARCGCALDYRGSLSGGRELAFYCQTCYEHVMLPQFIVARMLHARVSEPSRDRVSPATCRVA